MIASSCPQCAAPTPLSLATTAVRCASCGYDGPPAAAVAEQLARASAILRQVDVRERQLAGWARAALASGRWPIAAYLAVATLVNAPMLVIAIFGAWSWAESWTSTAGLLWFATPTVVSALATIGGLRWLGRRRAALRLQAAAAPPAAPGSTASCRVCGASLDESAGPVVRCGYCEADNLVDPSVLGQVAVTKLRSLENLVDTVREGATGLRVASRRAGCALAGVGCATPVALLVATTALALVLASIPTAPSGASRYAVVQTAAGRCVALVTQRPGNVRLSYGGAAGTGAIAPEDRPSTAGLSVGPAQTLVGRQVRVHASGVSGTVVRVQGTLLGSDVAVLRLPDGSETSVDIPGLCLAGVE
jgi:uncharacterized Zn finger protein (UPF0148 family)